MPRLIPDDIGGALIPDDDGAAASPASLMPMSLMNALELPRRHRMVLNRDGEPPDRGIERWPLGYRPGTQYVARLQTEIEMQRRRVVQLDDKSRQDDHAPVSRYCGHRPAGLSAGPRRGVRSKHGRGV